MPEADRLGWREVRYTATHSLTHFTHFTHFTHQPRLNPQVQEHPWFNQGGVVLNWSKAARGVSGEGRLAGWEGGREGIDATRSLTH